MFQIRQAFSVLATAAILAVGTLVPISVQAASLNYSWQDANGKTIVAQGGPFKKAVDLAANGNAVNSDGTPDTKHLAFVADTTVTCGGKATKVSVEIDVATSDYKKTYPTPGQVFVTPDNGGSCQNSGIDANAQIAKQATHKKPDSPAAPGNTPPQQCDQGSFSWVACPLMENISSAVTGVAQKVLVPLLQVKPLSAGSTPGIYQAWSNIKNFAEVLFVFLFMLTIISSAISFGLDQYTIKRVLPRLVAATILIQFSFFICAVLVDMGNIGGSGIQDLILANFNTGGSQASAVNVVANVGVIAPALALGGFALFANFVMALPTLLLLLIGVLGILFTLAARYMLIALLVAVSPLAVLAWVLPNTEHYFKKWISFLTRLILMYPLIIGVLSVVSRLTEILGFTDGATTNAFANFLTDVLKPFLLIASLLVVPFAFKWAGGIMHTVHNQISGVTSKGQGKLRSSDWYQEKLGLNQRRNIDRMKNWNDKLANQKYLGGAKGVTGTPGRAAAGMLRGGAGMLLAGAPSTAKAIEKRQSQYISADNKALNDLEMGQDVGALLNVMTASYDKSAAKRRQAMQWLEYNAPALLPYTKTEAGRMAVLKQLADKKSVGIELMENIAEMAPGEYASARRATGKAFANIPTVQMRYGEGEMEFNKTTQDWDKHTAGEVRVEGLRGVISGWDEMTIKSDLRPDNFEASRRNADVSRAMGEGLKYTVLENSLSSNSRVRAQAPKRAELYKWIAVQQKQLEGLGGNAAKILETARDQLGHNEDIYLDMIDFAVKGKPQEGIAPYTPPFAMYWNPDRDTWTADQRKRFLEAWLDQ